MSYNKSITKALTTLYKHDKVLNLDRLPMNYHMQFRDILFRSVARRK